MKDPVWMRNDLFAIQIKVQCKCKPYCWIFEGEIIIIFIKLLWWQRDFTVVNIVASTMPSVASSRKPSPRQCSECYQLIWAVQLGEQGWQGKRESDVIQCNAVYCHTSYCLTRSCAETHCVTLYCLTWHLGLPWRCCRKERYLGVVNGRGKERGTWLPSFLSFHFSLMQFYFMGS